MTDIKAAINVLTKNKHHFDYLRNLVKGEQECSEFQSLFQTPFCVDVVDSVISSNGDIIQSIVWHGGIAEMKYNLQKYLKEKPTNASEDAHHERATRELKRLEKLDNILREQGLEFIFIDN